MSLPFHIESAMKRAIEHLSASLSLRQIHASTHQTIGVHGWDLSQDNIQAIAHYLVGVRACAIDAALNICAALIDDSSEGRIDLCQSVYEIIGGSSHSLTTLQKTNERDPWLAEGIWHLCLAVAARRQEFHPLGRIVLLNYAHVAAKDHGLDVAAIYTIKGSVGISLVETKAYRNDPNGAINAAVRFFEEVDSGKHGTRIRQTVQSMRTSLPHELRNEITSAFWQRERAYICNPHYHAVHRVDWSRERRSFLRLAPKSDHIVVMPHDVQDFDAFFESLSEEMRRFVESL